ncbi:MAG: NfeD family protein [Phycisphaerales bacterium]|jgi:membrane-bound ClpP family serine protease|nr:hypothetical protein [Phycisphaeraceae bacterium]
MRQLLAGLIGVGSPASLAMALQANTPPAAAGAAAAGAAAVATGDSSTLFWGLALLGLAVLLLVIDVFVPSMGVLALTSFCVAVAAVVVLFNYSQTWGLIGATLVVIGGPIAFFFLLNIMPSTPIGRRLVLGSTAAVDGGAVDAAGQGGAGAQNSAEARLIGKQGVVLSDLRPVGTIRIDQTRYDALSDLGLIRAGTTVKVVAVDGATLKVRAVGT